MKLLIVSDNDQVNHSLARVGLALGFEVKATYHKFALAEFLSWEPTHIIVGDYRERKMQQKAKTYRDLTASATGKERLVRTGFEKYDHPDYIQLPFLIDDIRRILLG